MSRIKQSVIENIKRLSIADVIGANVELIRKGRNIVALCPFHTEKTPSFHVNDDKGFFKCFGCNEAGDVITFVMKYKNLDYVDAVTYICENYGIELEFEEGGASSGSSRELKAIHEFVADDAQKALFSGRGVHALEYLLKRGFSEDTIKSFEIGYIPNDYSVQRLEKNFSRQVIKESGIFYYNQTGAFCFFADRIIFPIRTATGACVGFSGRSMNPDDRAKYKNSPETPVFSKRRELYNLHTAKDSMKDEKVCYITEGYFDVIRMVEAGYLQTVAIMGTAFTAQQVSQLKRYVEEYNLILDGDEAGRKAMMESANVALESNIYPYVIFLPQGEDPDSFIKNNGKEAFDRLKEGKKDLFLHIIESERAKGVDNNRKFYRFDIVKKLLLKIKDPYRREYYAQEAARIFEVSKDMLYSDININIAKNIVSSGKRNKKLDKNLCEREFLSLLLLLPEDSADGLVSDMSEDYFEDSQAKLFFNKMIEFSCQSDKLIEFANDPQVGEIVSELLIYGNSAADPYKSALEHKSKLRLNYCERHYQALVAEQKNTDNEEEKLKIFMKIQDTLKEIKNLKLQSVAFRGGN